MSQPITGSYPITFSAVDGTTTTAFFHVKGNNTPLVSIGGFTVSIPTGLTATVSITHDQNTAVAGSTWVDVGTTLAGPQEFSYKSGSSMGIKITRTAGSGTVPGEVTEFSGGGGGTASSPSVIQGPAADNAAASGNPVRVGAKYNLSTQTYADGDIADLQADVNGLLKTVEGYQAGAEDNTNGVIGTQNKPLAVATYAWSVDQSAALEASTVTKASAGVLRKVIGRIDSTHATLTYYVQGYNAASLPADGAVTHLFAPKKVVHVNGTDSNFELDFTDNGIFASTGIVLGLSTSEFTKTISGAFTSSTVLFK